MTGFSRRLAATFAVLAGALFLGLPAPLPASSGATRYVPSDAQLIVRASVPGLRRESDASELDAVFAGFLNAWGLNSTSVAQEIVFAFVGGGEGQAILIVRGNGPLQDAVLAKLRRTGPVEALPARGNADRFMAGPGAIAFAEGGTILLAAEQPAQLDRMLSSADRGGASALPGFGGAASGQSGVVLYAYTPGLPSWARQQGGPMLQQIDQRLARLGGGPALGQELSLLMQGRVTEVMLLRGASGLTIRARFTYSSPEQAERLERALRSLAGRLGQAASAELGDLAGAAMHTGLQSIEVRRQGNQVWLSMPKSLADLLLRVLPMMAG